MNRYRIGPGSFPIFAFALSILCICAELGYWIGMRLVGPISSTCIVSATHLSYVPELGFEVAAICEESREVFRVSLWTGSGLKTGDSIRIESRDLGPFHEVRFVGPIGTHGSV